MNLNELARKINILKEAVNSFSKRTINYKNVKSKLRLVESFLKEEDEEGENDTGTGAKMTGNPGVYNEIIFNFLRDVERNNKYLELSYPRKRAMPVAIRFSIDPAISQGKSVSRDVVIDQLFSEMLNKFMCEKYDENNPPLVSDIKSKLGKIFIRRLDSKNKPLLNDEKIPQDASSHGGIELALPSSVQPDEEDALATFDVSHYLEFEVKGGSRTDSAVNTKLREVTPCIIFELVKRGKIKIPLQKICSNPKGTFKSVKNAILSLDQNYINNDINGGSTDGPEVLPNCTTNILRNCYNFEFGSNEFRTNAYLDGVRTLEYAINNPNYKDKIDYIKYTGLATMSAGSKGSTEDISIVLKKENFENELDDNNKIEKIDISLKSGEQYKARDFTFESFLGLINGKSVEDATKNDSIETESKENNDEDQQSSLNDPVVYQKPNDSYYHIWLCYDKKQTKVKFNGNNTIVIPAEEPTENPKTGKKNKTVLFRNDVKSNDIANAYFELIEKIENSANSLLTNALQTMLYSNPEMLIWNVRKVIKNVRGKQKEINEVFDITDKYRILSNYRKVTLTKSGNTKNYNIEFSDRKKEKDESGIEIPEKNDYFRIRWYKRDGLNSISKYKLVIEPRPIKSKK